MKKKQRDIVNPSLFDHYYLEGTGRVGKLKEIFTKNFTGRTAATPPLFLLDLGGRESPYEQLARGLPIRWISGDIKKYARTDLQLDAQALPIKDGVLDVVLCNQVLELIPDLISASAEIHRVVKPGGIAVISNPAVFPPYGGAKWRIMPEGYKVLFGKFSECQIDADLKTVCSFFRVVNMYLAILLHRVPFLKNLWRYSFCPLFNLLGRWANLRFKDIGFAANYVVIARK